MERSSCEWLLATCGLSLGSKAASRQNGNVGIVALVRLTNRSEILIAYLRNVATADEANAYMFLQMFFLFFCCFFRPPQKYQTTVLGNG